MKSGQEAEELFLGEDILDALSYSGVVHEFLQESLEISSSRRAISA